MKSPKYVTIILCSREVTISFRGQNETQFFSGVLERPLSCLLLFHGPPHRFAFASQKKGKQYSEQERE